eukprot:jgi/Bigna1/73972/fgenesh1_pg.27_\
MEAKRIWERDMEAKRTREYRVSAWRSSRGAKIFLVDFEFACVMGALLVRNNDKMHPQTSNLRIFLAALPAFVYTTVLPCEQILCLQSPDFGEIDENPLIPTPYFKNPFLDPFLDIDTWSYCGWLCALIAVVAACVLGIPGGYFFREYHFLLTKPEIEGGDRDLWFAPNRRICAAPVVLNDAYLSSSSSSSSTASPVKFWAVDDGSCCSTKETPSCANWDKIASASEAGHDSFAGIRVAYQDRYDGIRGLITSLSNSHNLTTSASEVTLLRWENPATYKKALTKNALICLAASAAIFLLGTGVAVGLTYRKVLYSSAYRLLKEREPSEA